MVRAYALRRRWFRDLGPTARGKLTGRREARERERERPAAGPASSGCLLAFALSLREKRKLQGQTDDLEISWAPWEERGGNQWNAKSISGPTLLASPGIFFASADELLRACY